MKLCLTLSSCLGPPHAVSKTSFLANSLVSQNSISVTIGGSGATCIKISTCLIHFYPNIKVFVFRGRLSGFNLSSLAVVGALG